jgi:hypothetical protein
MISSIWENRNKFFGLCGPFLGVPVGYEVTRLVGVESPSGKHYCTCSSFGKAHYASGDPLARFRAGLRALGFLTTIGKIWKEKYGSRYRETTQKEV